jgi:RNase H-fold protein (predicted Holliday junction resolvase)
MRAVLAIDPGCCKCGLAVVSDGDVLHKEVVTREEVAAAAAALAARYSVEKVIVGNGTGGDALVEALRTVIPPNSIETVDEANSSRRARARYLKENPPRGIRRLIPRGLQYPDRPYDDYVALILAEDYLHGA